MNEPASRSCQTTGPGISYAELWDSPTTELANSPNPRITATTSHSITLFNCFSRVALVRARITRFLFELGVFIEFSHHIYWNLIQDVLGTKSVPVFRLASSKINVSTKFRKTQTWRQELILPPKCGVLNLNTCTDKTPTVNDCICHTPTSEP